MEQQIGFIFYSVPVLIFESTFSFRQWNDASDRFHCQFIAWICYSHAPHTRCIHPMSCIHNLFVFPKTDSIVNILRYQLNQMHATFNHLYVRSERWFFCLVTTYVRTKREKARQKNVSTHNQSKYANWETVKGFVCQVKLTIIYFLFGL